jgi:hypothetical protein
MRSETEGGLEMLNNLSGEMVRYQIQDRVREVQADRATRAVQKRSQGRLRGIMRIATAVVRPAERRTFEPSPLRRGIAVESR